MRPIKFHPCYALAWPILLLGLAALACNLQGSVAPQKTQPDQPTAANQNLPEPSSRAGLVPDQPLPTLKWEQETLPETGETLPEIAVDPTQAALLGRYEPSSEELPTELGKTREKPYPPFTRLILPEWDFQVRQVLRGEQAWQLIQAQSPNTAPPPAGQEYLLVLVRAHCKNLESHCGDIGLTNLLVTGDSLRALKDTLWDIPMPELYFADIYTAEEVEGWTDALVGQDENNLMLVIDLQSPDPSTGEDARLVRYIALQDGASLSLPADLAAVQPNELGKTPQTPAPLGQLVVSNDWEITLMEALRGPQALAKVKQVNPDNPDPEAGMEYILFHIRLRFIGREDAPHELYMSNFIWTDASDNRYQAPTIYGKSDPPGFWAQPDLFPGGSAEGWMLVQAPAGQPGVVIFDPDLHKPGHPQENIRYLAVE